MHSALTVSGACGTRSCSGRVSEQEVSDVKAEDFTVTGDFINSVH